MAGRTVFWAYNNCGNKIFAPKILKKKGMIDMKEQKERLVSEGNAFYEIDLDCVRRREKEKQKKENQDRSRRQETRGGGG